MEQREVEEPLSILLINQYAGSPTLGMEHRPHWMSQRWLESGNAVTVVAGSYSHLRRTNPQDVGMRSARDVDGVPFVWIGTSRYRGNGFARVLSMIEFGSMLDRRLGDSLVDAPDVVIASSTHPFDVRASWRLARKFGALFVMEIHDLWPLTPQLLGGYKPSHPLIRFMQREADFGYQNADLIVSILPGTADYLQSRGMPEGNWTCIPNGWSPSQHAVPVSAATASAMRDLRLAFPFVIAYAGGFGLSNVLDELLDSASDLAAAGIAVALAGDGPRSGELRHRYGDEANIEFVGRLESAQVPNFLELADAGYLGVPDSPLYRHGISPNKIFDYMGAAKPILFVGEAFGNPVEAADCGVVVRSRQQLVEGAKRLARMSPSERASLGGSGHSYLKRNHSRALLSDRFLEALHATRERRPAAAR